MDKATLQTIGEGYQAVPVTLQFEMDNFEPINIFNALKEVNEPGFLLTGKPKKEEDGHTFIGLGPEETYTFRDHRLITTVGEMETVVEDADLKKILEGILAANKTPKLAGMPPFLGGIVGYFSYEFARYATMALKQRVEDHMNLDDADLLLIKRVIAYNHHSHLVTLSQIVATDDLNQRYDDVMVSLAALKETILSAKPKKLPNFALEQPFTFQFNLEEFTEKVRTTQKHIVDGDIFQLILSNPQTATMSGSLLKIAPTLFESSPSPYQFYFHHRDFETVGASPETLITKRDDQLFTYPLAGTRRRGKDQAEDDKFVHELQTSEKETSEHNMLIDLGRNDLGMVSQFGSVAVTRTRAILKFSNVMHMGSTVESTANPNATALDIVNAVLPAGTLSGAPKISAMQIISQLENRKRGLYGGCLGYFDFNGDLDFCIGIRLAYRKGEKIVVHSGAGIVSDSIPKQEYQEYHNKARSVMNAIQKVNEGGTANVVSN